MTKSIHRKLFYISLCVSVLIVATSVLYSLWHNSHLSKIVKTESPPMRTPAAAPSHVDNTPAFPTPEYEDSPSHNSVSGNDASIPQTA